MFAVNCFHILYAERFCFLFVLKGYNTLIESDIKYIYNIIRFVSNKWCSSDLTNPTKCIFKVAASQNVNSILFT